MTPARARRVLVVQRRLTHYRVAFFERLREEFARRDIELTLACGVGTDDERAKGDEGTLPWSIRLPTSYALGGRLCWQPFASLLAGHELVVLTPENKLVCNIGTQLFERRCRVALWGHGANLQGDPGSLRERFKRRLARRADWWFAYTELSRPLIEASGFDGTRVTVLNNSVDTSEMAQLKAAVSPERQRALRQQWGIEGSSVGIFLGSLYAEKRVEFMLAAADAIKRVHPAFEWLIVGAGPQRALVEEYCKSRPWARYLGMLKGAAKVEAMSLASLMINPGLVGLGILDSFVCEVPMFTTDCGLHSPEICYLRQGVNGVMTGNDLEAYVAAVAAALRERGRLELLRAGCRAAASEYTVENMARRFADGAVACLALPGARFPAAVAVT